MDPSQEEGPASAYEEQRQLEEKEQRQLEEEELLAKLPGEDDCGVVNPNLLDVSMDDVSAKNSTPIANPIVGAQGTGANPNEGATSANLTSGAPAVISTSDNSSRKVQGQCNLNITGGGAGGGGDRVPVISTRQKGFLFLSAAPQTKTIATVIN
jgi:hypothetical protein